MTLVAVCAVALFGAGCQSPVPANEAKFGDLTFRFPLDADITGLELVRDGKNKLSLKATRWRSKNAPDVIKNSYEGEAILIEATGNVAAKVGAAVVEGAVKGAK